MSRKVARQMVLGVTIFLVVVLSACDASEVQTNKAPTVTIVRPEADAVFGEDETIEVAATASDEDGNIARVEFLVNGTGLADAAAPYQINFQARDLKLGSHSLSVRAYDDAGASSAAAELSFSVQPATTTRFRVTATVTGEGLVTSDPAGISCGNACTADFAQGTLVTLTAGPGEGNLFTGWRGDCSGTGTCALDLNGDVQVGAAFEPAAPGTFAVAVTKDGPGTVTSSPAGINCGDRCSTEFDEGTAVSLTATPTGGAMFAGWSGDCTGVGTCTLAQDAEVTATFEAAASDGVSEPFTIVFLPDTQNYVCTVCRDNNPDTFRWNPDIFKAQTKWIADNVVSENIAFVANGGDITENASRLEEWQVADAAYRTLDGVVPYSAAPGDHDYFPEEYRDGDTTYYRQFFGADRYTDYEWYGGSSPSGLSHYQRFTGGGQDFLNIGLEFEAPGPASDPSSTLGWAKAILEANPTTPTILSTHEYLKDSGKRRSKPSEQEACYQPGSGIGSEPCRDKAGTLDPNASSGEEIFETLVAPYPQVFMVLGAHYHQSDDDNTGPTSDNGEYHQVSVNSEGLSVYEMLANYQDYDNGGDGWLRLIEFLPEGGEGGLDRIQVQTYSPSRNDYQPGSASNFSFDLDFAERFETP